MQNMHMPAGGDIASSPNLLLNITFAARKAMGTGPRELVLV